jgi:hypothetical protein
MTTSGPPPNPPSTVDPIPTPAHETAAALLRKQQSTTARLRVGLPALLVHLEHTEVLAPEPTRPASGPGVTDGAARDRDPRPGPSRPVDDDDWLDPPPSPRTWF